MAHCDAVTNGYGVKFKGGAAGVLNGLFDGPADLIEMNVSGHYFTKAVGNADKRLVYVLVTKAAGVKQRPVRRPLKTLFYRVASHKMLPFSKNRSQNEPKLPKCDSNV
jgi:hypothetical protein